jgi:hypothetical protein
MDIGTDALVGPALANREQHRLEIVSTLPDGV